MIIFADFVYFQMWCKFLVLLKHSKKIKVLIKESEKFWPLHMFGELYQRPNSKYHRILETCFRFYRRLVFVVLAQYATSAIVSHKPMILSYGETQGLELRLWLFYFSAHTLYITVMFYIVLGFDGLFFYMVGHILSEMKLIKVAFENSNIQPQWNHEKRFRRATEHHIFVLQLCEVNVLNSLSNYLYFRFVESVNKVYSFMLLCQQFCYIFALCFASYLLLENG